MEAADIRRLPDLEAEHPRSKQVYADHIAAENGAPKDRIQVVTDRPHGPFFLRTNANLSKLVIYISAERTVPKG